MIARAADSSDEALAARAAAGDDAAFEALVVRYQHRVFRLACRLTSETDAPDIRMEMPADLEASLLAALRRAMHGHDG